MDYAFTGQRQDSYIKLIQMGARWYDPIQGRFLTEDTVPGNASIPRSLNIYSYARDDPVNLTDPSGQQVPLPWCKPGQPCFTGILTPLQFSLAQTAQAATGPALFALCLDLHTVSGGILTGNPRITAGDAVALCKSAYSSQNWSLLQPTFGFDKDLPTSAHELMGWYVSNYRGNHDTDWLKFDGTQPLTRELAKSVLIHAVRLNYYARGDINSPAEYEFSVQDYLASLGLDSQYSAGKGSLPISFFVGSFFPQVKTLAGDRVGFRIDNDTTLASGSHFRGRYTSGGFEGSVEDLIDKTPAIANEPLAQVVAGSKVISILRSRGKENSSGGGSLWQTYAWTEKRDPCLFLNSITMPRETYALLLDIRPWYGFVGMTDNPRDWPAK